MGEKVFQAAGLKQVSWAWEKDWFGEVLEWLENPHYVQSLGGRARLTVPTKESIEWKQEQHGWMKSPWRKRESPGDKSILVWLNSLSQGRDS